MEITREVAVGLARGFLSDVVALLQAPGRVREYELQHMSQTAVRALYLVAAVTTSHRGVFQENVARLVNNNAPTGGLHAIDAPETEEVSRWLHWLDSVHTSSHARTARLACVDRAPGDPANLLAGVQVNEQPSMWDYMKDESDLDD